MSVVSRFIVNSRGHGNVVHHVSGIPGINRHSGVFASICELGTVTGEPLDFPFIGDAAMEIRNVAPRDDGLVDVLIEVDWPDDLDFRYQLLVSND